MRRRDFLSSAAAAAALLPTAALAETFAPSAEENTAADSHAMPLGLLITPADGPEETIKRVHDLGFPTCFFSLDAYIGKFTPQLATQFKGLLAKYSVTCTTVEVVGPQPLVWDFMQGPTTIGLVPSCHPRRAYRRAQAGLRLRQTPRRPPGPDALRLHPGEPIRPSLQRNRRRHQGSRAALRREQPALPHGDRTGNPHDDVARPPRRQHAQPRRRPRHRQPHPLRQSQSRRRCRHPRAARALHACQGRPLAHQPGQAWRRSSHRHRSGRLQKGLLPDCAKPATRAPSPSSAKPTARSRSKMSAKRSSTSKRCSRRLHNHSTRHPRPSGAAAHGGIYG